MATEARTDVQKAEKTASRPSPSRRARVRSTRPPSTSSRTTTRSRVLADMPGVKAPDLEIDLRENVLTLTGRVTPPEDVEGVERASRVPLGHLLPQFTLSETIDQAKIDAQLTDGVLRLELPKVEQARPRQITVRGG